MAAARAESTPDRRLLGVEGVWVFLAVDMVFFAVLFVSFMMGRQQAPEIYEAARLTLNADIGGINTLILLTSSWFVVLATKAARDNHLREARRWVAAALGFGLVFVVTKACEYGLKIGAGITPLTNDFYMYYYILTGFHFMHVMGGSVLLLILWLQLRKATMSSNRMALLESGGAYWHMVDLLWVILFPLLYLLQ